MEIGLRAFIQIADTIQQQKEANCAQPPQMPITFTVPSNVNEPVSIYLNQSHSQHCQMRSRTSSVTFNQSYAHNMSSNSSNPSAAYANRPATNGPYGGNLDSDIKPRIMLSDPLVRELGLSNHFEHVRRIFQDILKTLDATIGRTFLMTRPENALMNNAGSNELEVGKQTPLGNVSGLFY